LGFYKEASELGDCVASYELANRYANGTGTTQDLAKSVEILELAAKQGSWRAKLALGSYYRFGWLSSFLAPHHQGYREINKEVISPEKAFFITLILLIKHQNRTHCIDECSISFRVDVSRRHRCCTGL
jgi:TPR repeat protein